MTLTEIIDIAESEPFATARQPYGPDTLTFEIEGKQFCLFDLSYGWNFYNLKIDPVLSEELRERYPEILPGYHMNKRHWISVGFEGIPRKMHKMLIRHAHLQTVKGMSKAVKAKIFGSVEEFDRQLADSISELREIKL